VISIEDEEPDTQLLMIELRRGGFDLTLKRVETRDDLGQAVEQGEWDVILADHTLPAFDSLSALRLLKEKDLDIPFILVSGTISDDLAVKALKMGAQDFVTKGNLKRLIPAIERSLEENSVRRKLEREEKARLESEQRYRKIFEHSNDAILILDPAQDEILEVNPKACEMLKLSREALLQRRVSDLHPGQVTSFQAFFYSVLKQGTGSSEQFTARTPAGEEIPLSISASLIHHQERNCLLAFMRDITAQRRSERKMRELAFVDALTRLPNRAQFLKTLASEIQGKGGDARHLAVLLIDLDRFKEVNDTLGHRQGDLLLKQVGQRLEGTLRPGDTIGRLGGDEFGLLLPLTCAEDAILVAQKVLSALDAPFELDELPISVEPSLGIALLPEHGRDVEHLLQHADVAMYAAKKTGKKFVVYSPKIDRHTHHQLVLLGELYHAIKKNQLLLQYQPKIDLKNGLLVGLEALVRWQHPILGLLPPGRFVPLAEQTGIIGPMTDWVVSEAVAQYQRWRQEGFDFCVAVNLSARNLLENNLPDQVASLLKKYGMPPRCLEMEITETSIMSDVRQATEVLSRLKKIGVRFSIDDYGTGYSSLSYLRRLAVDAIKIDRSFVFGMKDDADDEVIVRSIVELGHNLGLKVIAEGVEDQETWGQLLAMGCDIAQGYHIARPIPSDQVISWFKTSGWSSGCLEASGP